MARPQRSARIAVAELLRQSPERFEFFQAVQILEGIAAREQRVAVGADGPLADEAIRFRSAVTSTFPAAEIDQLKPRLNPDDTPKKAQANSGPLVPCELTVNFLGLVGPQGTLPHHYTQLVVSRLHPRHKDETLRQFLDQFHHRSISLFFRAWQKHHLPASFEAAHVWRREKNQNLFQFILLSLVGLGTDSLSARPISGINTVLGFSGHFAHTPRNASSLERLLGAWLQWRVQVQQFSGRWLPLPVSSQSAFPSARRPQGQNLALGVSTIAGSRVWEAQGKFRVQMGPMSYSQFVSIMPNGSLFSSLCDLIRLYAGIEFDFDLQPLLDPQEIPPCQLNSQATEHFPLLGWNTWMCSRPPSQPAAEATFRPPPLT